MQVITPTGQLRMLQYKRGAWGGGQLRAFLFTNAVVPVNPNLLANWTQPAVTGYAAQMISFVNPPFTNGGGFGELDASTLALFTATAPFGPGVLIQGYMVQDPTFNSEILAYEFNPSGPVLWSQNGIPYAVQYVLQESQFNPLLP